MEAENDTAKEAESTRRRYPKRSVVRKDYTEGSEPDDDDYIFCDDCNQEWEGDCPVHGPLTVMEDTKVPQDPADPTRVNRTVPSQLCIAKSGIIGAGYGMWTRVPLAKGLRFGPYKGVKAESSNSNTYCWQIHRNSRPLYCVDAENCCTANWMRYVNCARHEEEQNLMAFQYQGEMYYRTFKNVPAHTELLVWYGDDYARELGIDVENFHKPQQKESHDVFGCDGCGITYTSPLYLEKHAKYCRGLKGARLSNGSALCSVKSCSSNSNDRFSGNTNHVERLGTSSGSDTCGSRCLQTSDLSECDRQKTHQGRLSGHKSMHPKCLTVHVKTHMGESCYKNKQYGQKCAVQISTLKQRQTVRTEGKAHVCKECGSKFTRKGHLEQHSRIHTGEKPYVCKECGSKFNRKSNLVRHSRVHT